MITVLIGDKKFSVEDGAPFKEVLTEYEELFPRKDVCEGFSIKEKVLAYALSDRREITLNGETPITESLFITRPSTPRPVTFVPTVAAVFIGADFLDVTLTDGNEAECYSYLSPFYPLSLAEQIGLSDKKKEEYDRKISSFVCEKIEGLLKTAGQEKIKSAFIGTSGFFLAALKTVLPLPYAEKTTVLPYPDQTVGSLLFCRSVCLPENSFLIDCDRDATILQIGKDNNVYAYMWEFDYSPLALAAVIASVRVLKTEGTFPMIYLYGPEAYRLEESLEKEELPYAHAEDYPEKTAKNCLSIAYIAKLEQEKRRTSFCDLLKNEDFQEELVKIYNAGE